MSRSHSAADGPRRERISCYALSIGVALAMISPALRGPAADGFPLSTYPMFARPVEAEVRVHAFVGVPREGTPEGLGSGLVYGDNRASPVIKLAERASRWPPAKRRALCDEIAARVAAEPSRAARYVEVQLVTEIFDLRAYLGGERAPRVRERRASCRVPSP